MWVSNLIPRQSGDRKSLCLGEEKGSDPREATGRIIFSMRSTLSLQFMGQAGRMTLRTVPSSRHSSQEAAGALRGGAFRAGHRWSVGDGKKWAPPRAFK